METEWNINPKMMNLIDDFFDRLEMMGIHCEHDWSCCKTCGHAEMKSAWEKEEFPFDGDTAEKGEVCKYVFYNGQEFRNLQEGSTECYLSYELPPEDEAEIRKWVHLYGEWKEPKTNEDGSVSTYAIVLRLPSSSDT